MGPATRCPQKDSGRHSLWENGVRVSGKMASSAVFHTEPYLSGRNRFAITGKKQSDRNAAVMAPRRKSQGLS